MLSNLKISCKSVYNFWIYPAGRERVRERERRTDGRTEGRTDVHIA